MSNRFSIIIPTYNSSATLVDCLESIICQTYKDVEVWIIDGYSNDSTIEIIKDYAAKFSYIKWLSEKDNGIYDAMNKGVKLAKGSWLYFLGSDDSLYDENVLLRINSVAVSCIKSKFIYGNVMTSNTYVQKYNNYNYQKLLEMCICQQAIFYHYSLFKSKIYNLRYRLAADWDFNLRVFRKKNYPIYVDCIIANYSLNGASSNWSTHPEYVKYFTSNKKATLLRYRGFCYLGYSWVKWSIERLKIKLFN